MLQATVHLWIVVVLLLGLAGCDNTSVAFCSGGDEFCEKFFLKVGADDEPRDDEEPDPVDPVEPTNGAVQAALKIARLTPRPIENALAYARMGSLATEQPDLVGLWLIAASLGRLREPEDNATTTQFLDQNRAWLSAQVAGTGHAGADLQVLGAGLQLYAAFAADLDPAAAGLGRALADAVTVGDAEPQALETVSIALAARSVVAAARAPAHCCTPAVLAAAAVILCELNVPERALAADTDRRACAHARRLQHAWISGDPGG